MEELKSPLRALLGAHQDLTAAILTCSCLGISQKFNS